MDKRPCRCGWDGVTGPHPCHSNAYTCGQPAQERIYYRGQPFSLAGVQMKLSVDVSYACDECWSYYQKYLKNEITEKEWLDKAWITARRKNEIESGRPEGVPSGDSSE